MKEIILYALLVLLIQPAIAQHNNNSDTLITHLEDQFGNPLAGNWVQVNNKMKYQSDIDGFLHWTNDQWPAQLEIELQEGEKKLIEINSPAAAKKVVVEVVQNLNAVIIQDQSSKEVSTLKTRNVERITSEEFKKAACCRLSESFDNSGSVNVSETDAVTGAKEMEILGLRGKYSLMTFNNTPDFIGLGYPFGLDMIPGTWLETVAISKGISNSLNGSSSFTGQVSVQTKDPKIDEPLFINLFGNTMGRYEANIHLNKLVTDKLGIGAYLHGSKNFQKLDQNKDGFLDMPLSEQMNGMVKAHFNDSKLIEGGLTVHLVQDQRQGGSLDKTDGFEVNTLSQRLNVNGNLGYLGFKKEGRSAGIKYQYTRNDLDANFGKLNYNGAQDRIYIQGLFEDRFAEGLHILYGGVSYLNEKLNESLADMASVRHENVPGVYVEYAYNPEIKNADKKFLHRVGMVASARVDFHNLYGTQLAPSIAVKYNFTENTILRLNFGKGFKTPYFFSENLSAFSNGRPVAVLENLRAEEAINYGASITSKLKLFYNDLSINVDAYRTQFQNQILADMESNPLMVQIYNLKGESYSNSFLTSVNYNILKGLTLKLAYKYTDAVFDQLSGKVRNALLPAHRGLMALHYNTADNKWEFSNSTHLTGKQEYMLRSVENGVASIRRADAKPYIISNLQITRKWKKLDIYVGGENLGNVVQQDPIQHASDVQSAAFDVTQVYAPIIGIRGYVGLRWSPFKK